MTWTVAGEWDFELSLRTQTTSVPHWLSLACFDGYHPECQLADNFGAVEARYRALHDLLARGFLVLCGQSYLHNILPNDAVQVIAEIEALKRNPPPHCIVGDQLVYGSVELVGGKYVLTTSEVADLVGYR